MSENTRSPLMPTPNDNDSRQQSQYRTVRAEQRSFEALKIVVSIVGVVLVISQYFSQKWDGRIQRSLQQIDKYISSSPITAEADQMIKKMLKERADPYSSETIESAISTLMSSNEDYVSHIVDLDIFYNAVASCANEGTCDRFTSCEFFFPRISIFYALHKKHFLLDDKNNKMAKIVSFFNDDKLVNIKRFVDGTCNPDVMIKMSSGLGEVYRYFNLWVTAISVQPQ